MGIPTGAPGESRLPVSPGAARLRDDLRFGSSEGAEVSGLGFRGESIPALGLAPSPTSYPVVHVGGRDQLRLCVDPYPRVVRYLVEDRDATGGGARFEGANTPFARGGGKGRRMKGSQAVCWLHPSLDVGRGREESSASGATERARILFPLPLPSLNQGRLFQLCVGVLGRTDVGTQSRLRCAVLSRFASRQVGWIARSDQARETLRCGVRWLMPFFGCAYNTCFTHCLPARNISHMKGHLSAGSRLLYSQVF